ncbi:uncharacterized protein LOC118559400 isoform X2 [Fundulus heteroclitus]|uniref:uncharacterized protein LOC118559400 isoform X2 n=1 Tax=Fundulus heteroclitus TaxID=8078 RepID=UPI00165CD48B|nr:uncharacterized protein LOC118559400 isoform X2 [Fundulus heteroclitus]
MGFSGNSQTCYFSKPVECLLPFDDSDMVFFHEFLIEKQCPINLLARDLIATLRAAVVCSFSYTDVIFPNGRIVRTQNSNTNQMNQTPCIEELNAFVWWGNVLHCSDNSLSDVAERWDGWTTSLRPYSTPADPLHVTLNYLRSPEQVFDIDKYQDAWEMTMKLLQDTYSSDELLLWVSWCNIFIGPQGVAAAAKLPEELQMLYQLAPDMHPHFTLKVANGEQAKNLGPMVKKAVEATDWQKVQGSPHMEYSPGCNTYKLIYEGKMATAEVVNQPQYPLSPEKVDGIRGTISGLLSSGVLVPCDSPYNTPITPVAKHGKQTYRLVHDLRKINSGLKSTHYDTPNPYTMLSNLERDFKWFTVMDLSNAFFCVPIHPDCQKLFAFTFEGQQYTYTRLPQGLTDSPSLFNHVLQRLMQDFDHPLLDRCSILQYVDDILLAGPTEQEVCQLSADFLTWLNSKGFKVSKEKMQCCRARVVFLGRIITAQGWGSQTVTNRASLTTQNHTRYVK